MTFANVISACWWRRDVAIVCWFDYNKHNNNNKIFFQLPFFPACFWDLWSHKPSRVWFFVCVGPSTVSYFWWPSWIFLSLSTSFYLHPALQFSLFMQFIRKPASTIFWPAEMHLEFSFFSLISSPLGKKYQGQYFNK